MKEEGHVMMGARCYAAGFEDGGRDREPRKARNAALEAGRGKKAYYFLEPPALRPMEL